jgi:hypothetical protein
MVGDRRGVTERRHGTLVSMRLGDLFQFIRLDVPVECRRQDNLVQAGINVGLLVRAYSIDQLVLGSRSGVHHRDEDLKSAIERSDLDLDSCPMLGRRNLRGGNQVAGAVRSPRSLVEQVVVVGERSVRRSAQALAEELVAMTGYCGA